LIYPASRKLSNPKPVGISAKRSFQYGIVSRRVYPDQRGLPPRRIAACRVPSGEPVSALFTFLGSISGGSGLLEQQLIAVRIAPDLGILDSPQDTLRILFAQVEPGEISKEILEKLFKATFDAMASEAAEKAAAILRERGKTITERRRLQADILRKDLETDLSDRLKEIDEAERHALGLIDFKTGQMRIFADMDSGATGFQSKRAAAKASAAKRRNEIDAFEMVAISGAPKPLGALLLVPEDVS